MPELPEVQAVAQTVCPLVRGSKIAASTSSTVDPLAREFAPKHFQSLVSESRRPLKEFLPDHTRVAGIGNIYSAESL